MAGANKTFRVTLGDGVSGPARKGAAALKKLALAMRKVNTAARAAKRGIASVASAAAGLPSGKGFGIAGPRGGGRARAPRGPQGLPLEELAKKVAADQERAAKKSAAAFRKRNNEEARWRKQQASAAARQARKNAAADKARLSAADKQRKAQERWNKSVAKAHAQRDKELKLTRQQTKAAGRLRWRLAANMVVGNLVSRGLEAAGRAAWELGKRFVLAIGHGIKVGESLRFSLTRFLKTAPAAEKALADIMKVSNYLGVSFEEAGTDFKNFISAGASQLEAMDLIKFKADIVALGDGSERSLQRVQEAFIQVEKAMATGRFEADGFNSILANLPVTKQDILAKLVKVTGKSLGELMKMDITKLPVKETIKAMQEALLEATGEAKLGTTAWKKQASTLSGLWNALKNRAANVFTAVGLKMGPKLANAVLPHLKKLAKWMASPEFAAGLGKIATGVADFVSESIPKLMAFGEGFAETFEPITSVAGKLMDVADALDIGDGPAESWRNIGEAFAVMNTGLAMIAPALSLVKAALSAVVDYFTSWIGDIKAQLNAIPEAISSMAGACGSAGSGLGTAIIQGLVSAIIPGPIVAKLGSVIDSAIGSAKGKLGIGSPSKVFEEIGMWTGMGLSKGIEAQSPAVSRAAANLIRPTLPSQTPANTTNLGGVSAPVNISVNAADDPEATAAAVRRMLITELGDMFEQVSLQVGAA